MYVYLIEKKVFSRTSAISDEAEYAEYIINLYVKTKVGYIKKKSVCQC